MSKHLKEVRRERRKVEAGRRQRLFLKPQASSLKSGAAALAAAAVIAAGTQAYADPVRYDNLPEGAPGWFDWKTPNPEQSYRWLDVTKDVGTQPSGVGGNDGFGHTGEDAGPWQFIVALDDVGGAMQVGGYADYVVVGVPSDTLIPSGFTWQDWGYVDFYGAETPEGLQSYLGVRFDPGDGLHYGWIGVVRTGTQFDAFAWGYETEVGVAIEAGVPEPGSLALLAFGAAAALRRRRQA